MSKIMRHNYARPSGECDEIIGAKFGTASVTALISDVLISYTPI